MKTKSDNTKERILEKASSLIQTRGFQATSISDIITASGITKGGFYHHFLNKNELGLAIIERAKCEFMEFLDKILTSDTPKNALVNFLDAVLIKHSNTGFIGGCIFGNIALEMADGNSSYAIAVTQVFDEWILKLEKVIITAQTEQQVRSDINAHELANFIVTTVEGGIMLSRLKKTQQHLDDCLKSLKDLLFKSK